MDISDIGFIGLGVMGENLILNIERNGFRVVLYNRTPEKVQTFLDTRAAGKRVSPADSVRQLIEKLKRPRKIILMIQAGEPVDAMIKQLIPLLEPGDIIIDGGNSHFKDTNRRVTVVENHGMFFIGCGISGGEHGALWGPSIMPGGSQKAWPEVSPLLNAIAAKTADGDVCCSWIGSGGAGHFVKMIHNGIEYGDMQIICEAYHIMKKCLGFTPEKLHEVFSKWNTGDLNSYLIEITADIFTVTDEKGGFLIDQIADVAMQKGTGQWTVITALQLKNPLSLIGESLFSRYLSALKKQRTQASQLLGEPKTVFKGTSLDLVNALEQALFCSKVVSYSQGFSLMADGASQYGWNLNFAEIAAIWRAGCIIRSTFLDKIRHIYTQNPRVVNLLVSDYFVQRISAAQSQWRSAVVTAIQNGVPVPAMASGLNYYDAYRANHLPTNLLQAQRDYFGHHGYQRIDNDSGQSFHTDWENSIVR
ncbi:MAG: decarboxylating NADP(+)-dependent phosphogluconate dehydrogenase [Chitinivibrionales bacterium]|nr:decarboxylating NADP(+)-dependent phosphogluconate dehydrogenase [Chitinivibrionales bacterium]